MAFDERFVAMSDAPSFAPVITAKSAEAMMSGVLSTIVCGAT
jgi:hypothetical protein